MRDTTEWKILLKSVGGKKNAGIMLKTTTAWGSTQDNKGADAFFFSAYPAGYWDKFEKKIVYTDTFTEFWSSSDRGNKSVADIMRLSFSDDSARVSNEMKHYGLSVRCVKD